MYNFIETTDEKTQEELMKVVRMYLGKGVNAWHCNEIKSILIEELSQLQ